ncbi:hypothetical protein [Sulfobacillus thermosulfidooxidans]|uniref:hypothetical protein n=1 Tax=Sulfobacillus thermosulfidooxidans TaxID=28034 RepID=UPI00031E5C11|nr:hypothetical protein [Sulfobacillus thermosulfidooxidans]
MDIRDVAKIKADKTSDKVIVELPGVNKEAVQDLVNECSGGSCSCGDEEFLANIDSFTLLEDGQHIEIRGQVTADEVAKTLKDWKKEI